jgi:alpha-L-rhamnosidase
MRVTQLRFEHHGPNDTIGIGEATPRLSWLTSGEPVAYEIELDDGEQIWRSGRIDSSRTTLVPWPAEPLSSRQRRTVRVRAWESGTAQPDDQQPDDQQPDDQQPDDQQPGDHQPGEWSEPATLETGLLTPEDWSAQPISPELDGGQGDPPHPVVLLRREFHLDGDIRSARLYATAHGLYELELNGQRVGNQTLAPGWNSYQHQLRYQSFDVTDLLRGADNVLGAWLADGWFRGALGFAGGRKHIYGDRTALLAQLEVTYQDGQVQRIGTDGEWRGAPSPILSAGLYEGELYDARLETPGWSQPGFDDRQWSAVTVATLDLGTLVAPSGPPVRNIETLTPVSGTVVAPGRTILDFGQNISGRLRITVTGAAGQRVQLRHAEVLVDGELYVRPLRAAKATDVYLLADRPGPQQWEPRFTVHGFRYAEVESELPVEAVAQVLHTDLEPAGWFSCSDPLINQLHRNVRWSMRDNFVDIPTDCPQRDERLGWTGDIQVFAPTASYLYRVPGMLTSWLRDLAADQRRQGTVPHFVPWIDLGFPLLPAAAWGDAAVMVPWTLYWSSGDLEILRVQYHSMKAWVDQIAELSSATGRWDQGFQFGDWLDPAAPADRPGDARTDKYLVATAYHAYTADLLARTAGLLGKRDDQAYYQALAARVREAFCQEYVSPTGRLVSDTQTAYALALRFGLLTRPDQREHAGKRLVELVRSDRYRIATGFVGTPLICDALCSVGAPDLAYHLLTQRECPSWLYPVTMGATTIWERWDSLLPDGTVNHGEMTSFNHYALGAVADWLHRVVGGLAPAAAGYRKLLIAPQPGGGLSGAETSHETPFGLAEVKWVREGEQLTVKVLVPAGTTAEIRLPDPRFQATEVGAGEHRFGCHFRPVTEDPSIPVPENWT